MPVVQPVAYQPEPSRLVYPYSVIPGGVQDAAELKSALRQDPVAAEHYRGFNVDSATPIRMPIEKLAYVSYRIGDRIYWTSHQVLLARDERVLTDGSHLIRSRCGNRISFERQPGEKTSVEPAEVIMDLPADSFSDSTLILPWNEDGMIMLPSAPGKKTTSTATAPPGRATPSTPTSGGSTAGFGLPRFVVALPSQVPPTGSLPVLLTTGTGGTVLNVPTVIVGGQLQLIPPGVLPTQPEAPISSIGTAPTTTTSPGSGQKPLPLPVSPGTLISESPLIDESVVTGISNSPENFFITPPLYEVTIEADQIDQAPSQNIPEPETYSLTGGGLLLVIAISRKKAHVSARC